MSASTTSDPPAVQDHLEAARLLAGSDPDFQGTLSLCLTPEAYRQFLAEGEKNLVVAPPTKVFDQLYYLGMNSVGSWALVTSDGIIQFDALDNAEEAQRIIVGGYKKLGLDPAKIKYLVISHGHGDHYGGAKYLQDTYHPRVIMGPADWDMIAKLPVKNAAGNLLPPPPARDMDAVDGQQLTLGKTTVTLYITPGHTPATISAIIPVTDHGQRHLLSFWGGTAFSQNSQALALYKNSLIRYIKIGQDAGVDGYISNHTWFENTYTDGKTDKIAKLQSRKPGQPHPFILGQSSFVRYMMIHYECLDAAQARIQAKASP